MATACGSCHIGGSIVEQDRNGMRLSMLPPDMTMQSFNAWNNYVVETFDSTTGMPAHLNNPFDPTSGTSPGFAPGIAMWSMPGTFDNKWTFYDDNGTPADPADDNTNAVVPGMFVPGANGWISSADPNGAAMIGQGMAIDGQMSMPNVREMDCFYCHLEGFNNIISSVAVQMGYLNAAPSLSSGLMNMFSQTYIPGTFEPAGAPMPGFEAFGAPVKLSGSFVSKIKADPPSDNCRQCHVPTTMATFSDMFDKFLAAAPMDYDPSAPGASLINGMVMPTYDLNAAFFPNSNASADAEGGGILDMTAQDSPAVHFEWDLTDPMSPMPLGWQYADNSSAAGPFGLFPMALDTAWTMMDPSTGMPNTGTAGGLKPGQTGPLYYSGTFTQDQNSLKKSTIPFPRADFFKRGDIWDDRTQDVHWNLGCAGCHFDTNVSDTDNPALSQCDPGRGRTRMGGVESGQTLNSGTTGGTDYLSTTTGVDTHDTVKRCQDCHVTGKNFYGKPIETFGALNPDIAHAQAGLLDNVTTAVRLDASGAEESFTGNHLDVMDCTVCHQKKEAMAVRALDSTSGNRYPTLIGFEGETKGMMAMFADPMPDHSMQNSYVEWKPIYGWHATYPKQDASGGVNAEWRRKLVPINFITAQMWDDSQDGGLTDANGDGGETRVGVDPNDIEWDPWIQRDMKAGMNFAGGPFATIPVGFGGGAFQSAYDQNFNFTGAFEWVGVYGGNAILTTPEQISGYKDHREAMKDAPGMDGKSWANTQLVFFGGNPFQVTHNIVPVGTSVLGRSCSDCHAPGSSFFSGDYDMTGSAVPASKFFPDHTGTPVKSNMMVRPVLDYEVVAKADDLRTGSEAKSKLTGAVLDVEFDTLGCWDPSLQGDARFIPAPSGSHDVATVAAECGTLGYTAEAYRKTHDLNRADMLYPVPHGTTYAAYYADGFADAAERAAYLESLGADPVADIALVDGAAPTAIVSIEQGAVVALDADTSSASNGSYAWTSSFGASATGASAILTFDQVGTHSVTLTVTNTTGQVVATDEQVFEVSAPAPPAAAVSQTSYTNTGWSISADYSIGATHNQLQVIWGDGQTSWINNTAATATLNHAYGFNFSAYDFGLGAFVYDVTVRAYNNGVFAGETVDQVQVKPW